MAKDIQILMKCGETSIASPYKTVPSKDFKKSWKRYSRSGIHGLDKIKDVVFRLANQIKLEINFKDHQLKGDMSHLRECHVYPDLLLIYSIDEEEKELRLVDIGSHSELFG